MQKIVHFIVRSKKLLQSCILKPCRQHSPVIVYHRVNAHFYIHSFQKFSGCSPSPVAITAITSPAMDDDDGNKKFTSYRDQDDQDESSSEMDSDATPTRKPNPKRAPPRKKTNAPKRNLGSPQISPKTVAPSGNRQHQAPAPRPPPPPAGHPSRRHNRHPLPSPTLRFTSASLPAASNNNRGSSRHNPEAPPRRYVSLPEPSALEGATANSTATTRSQQVTHAQQPQPDVSGPSSQPGAQPRTDIRPTRNKKNPAPRKVYRCPLKPSRKAPPPKNPNHTPHSPTTRPSLTYGSTRRSKR